jgi:hypothetical protein
MRYERFTHSYCRPSTRRRLPPYSSESRRREDTRGCRSAPHARRRRLHTGPPPLVRQVRIRKRLHMQSDWCQPKSRMPSLRLSFLGFPSTWSRTTCRLVLQPSSRLKTDYNTERPPLFMHRHSLFRNVDIVGLAHMKQTFGAVVPHRLHIALQTAILRVFPNIRDAGIIVERTH